jgi:hypothetical protein
MAHLSRWLISQELDVADLTSTVVEQFLEARADEGYARALGLGAVVPILDHLRGLGVAPKPAPVVPDGPIEVLIERYKGYLLAERGLLTGSVRNYVIVARSFLSHRFEATGGTLALEALRPRTSARFCSRMDLLLTRRSIHRAAGMPRGMANAVAQKTGQNASPNEETTGVGGGTGTLRSYVRPTRLLSSGEGSYEQFDSVDDPVKIPNKAGHSPPLVSHAVARLPTRVAGRANAPECATIPLVVEACTELAEAAVKRRSGGDCRQFVPNRRILRPAGFTDWLLTCTFSVGRQGLEPCPPD